MLEVKNLTKSFDLNGSEKKTVLNSVSLTINDGDFITVIGGNGAGKTTLLNMIAGVYLPDSGSIKIDDIDITTLPEYKRAKYLGRVFQDPLKGTAADMTILENLSIAARRGKRRGLSWGIRKNERKKYIDLLTTLDLDLQDRLNDKVGLLSGGQRQAVTLLMATIKKPKLLLLDEHTAALDPKTSKKVLDLTDKIIFEQNIPTLMITHNMQDAIDHGNRLIMMHKGEIILDIQGEAKKKLTVKELINKFEETLGDTLKDDSLILSK